MAGCQRASHPEACGAARVQARVNLQRSVNVERSRDFVHLMLAVHVVCSWTLHLRAHTQIHDGLTDSNLL
jgi:hypothetical protein